MRVLGTLPHRRRLVEPWAVGFRNVRMSPYPYARLYLPSSPAFTAYGADFTPLITSLVNVGGGITQTVLTTSAANKQATAQVKIAKSQERTAKYQSQSTATSVAATPAFQPLTSSSTPTWVYVAGGIAVLGVFAMFLRGRDSTPSPIPAVSAAGVS